MSFAKDLAQVHDAHVRLTMLQLLAGQAMGNASDVVMYEALNAMDLQVSRDAVRGHIFWLDTQGLVAVLDMRSSKGLVAATLTEKGNDVAKGLSIVAGVERAQRS